LNAIESLFGYQAVTPSGLGFLKKIMWLASPNETIMMGHTGEMRLRMKLDYRDGFIRIE